MGLINFIKNAGEKIFGKSEEKKEIEKADLIAAHIKKYGFNTNEIMVVVDDEKVTLSGNVDTYDTKNKIIVIAGNIEGISEVEDRLLVIAPVANTPVEPAKQYYTVKKGDYLSKIAKEMYGNANKYPIIFEANKPMLKNPDLIYPGQVLIIPSQEN
ncbi:MAG: peptidoglycan-binding protein LysM [Bacteroidales bacterium]|nr:peptidoglycan-binding protein LysM [Bacteroidales bacterium]